MGCAGVARRDRRCVADLGGIRIWAGIFSDSETIPAQTIPARSPFATMPAQRGASMTTEYPTGTRLRCERCGTELIILKSNEPVLECCGDRMQTTFVPAQRAADSGTEAH
jgi:hypothetical protein